MNTAESHHSITSLADVGKPPPHFGRRSFLIAATACAAQPVTALSGDGFAMKKVAALINRPCSILPGLDVQRLPTFICRASCQGGKYHCLEN